MKTIQIKLSHTSKMPAESFSTPAAHCITGSKLRKVPGSVCSDCYACKGRYLFSNVQAPRKANLAGIRSAIRSGDFEPWIRAMLEKLADSKAAKVGFFRWHDSGDLQSVSHLAAIAEIARRMPNVRFWLPTREKAFVLEYQRSNKAPDNLIIRVSAAMIDGDAPAGFAHTSTVHKSRPALGVECLAYTRGGKCDDCRACWDSNVANVSYPKH